MNRTMIDSTMTVLKEILDNASSNPLHDHFPSLAVNASGDMAMGFSGSKSTERIGAFFSARRASGSMPPKPILIQAGRDYFEANGGRYGDYTYTTPDLDNASYWTIQQYAELRSDPEGLPDQNYGLSLSQIKTNPKPIELMFAFVLIVLGTVIVIPGKAMARGQWSSIIGLRLCSALA